MENNMVYPCVANFAPDQLARKIIAENLSIGKGAAERPPFHSPRGIGRGSTVRSTAAQLDRGIGPGLACVRRRFCRRRCTAWDRPYMNLQIGDS